MTYCYQELPVGATTFLKWCFRTGCRSATPKRCVALLPFRVDMKFLLQSYKDSGKVNKAGIESNQKWKHLLVINLFLKNVKSLKEASFQGIFSKKCIGPFDRTNPGTLVRNIRLWMASNLLSWARRVSFFFRQANWNCWGEHCNQKTLVWV